MSAAPPGFAADWPAPPSVHTWVTERGGPSRYGTFNLATHVGDDTNAVAANRARLSAALALPAEPRWLTQVHGSEVLDLDRDDAARRALPRGAGAADGAVTMRSGVVCAVLTADCLPVAFCDREGRRIGIAHAGWRGLLAGILPKAVAAMRAEPDELLAWLGPAIGPHAYEVGAEVRDAFVAQDRSAAPHFAANDRGRWQADLYGLARDALEQAGVRAVHGGGFCTFTEGHRFFSHRREAPCGRMATLIWLDDPRS